MKLCRVFHQRRTIAKIHAHELAGADMIWRGYVQEFFPADMVVKIKRTGNAFGNNTGYYHPVTKQFVVVNRQTKLERFLAQ